MLETSYGDHWKCDDSLIVAVICSIRQHAILALSTKTFHNRGNCTEEVDNGAGTLSAKH